MMYTLPVSLQPNNNRGKKISISLWSARPKGGGGQRYMYTVFYSPVTVSAAPLLKDREWKQEERVQGEKKMP